MGIYLQNQNNSPKKCNPKIKRPSGVSSNYKYLSPKPEYTIIFWKRLR